MVFDDLLIGSGLSALGAARALLGRGRRVLCITGDTHAPLRTYPNTAVPLEYKGQGGLGTYWHGVIPLALSTGFKNLDHQSYVTLLNDFYRGEPGKWIGEERLFVPIRSIRPYAELVKTAKKNHALVLHPGIVERITVTGDGVEARVDGHTLSARQAILAAGALGTPQLLQRSDLIETRDRPVSDHLIGYAGRVRRENVADEMQKPIRRNQSGMAIPCQYSERRNVLYMLRPARFDLAALDAGIEKRAVFGLPTSRILAGLAGKFSAGLVSEALFNRFGILRHAYWQSINFLAEARDFYTLSPDGTIALRSANDAAAIINEAVSDCPFKNLEPTKRSDLFIPGIHLHGTLDAQERRRFAPEGSQRIKVVDASGIFEIGAEHHSFKMLAAAFQALNKPT